MSAVARPLKSTSVVEPCRNGWQSPMLSLLQLQTFEITNSWRDRDLCSTGPPHHVLRAFTAQALSGRKTSCLHFTTRYSSHLTLSRNFLVCFEYLYKRTFWSRLGVIYHFIHIRYQPTWTPRLSIWISHSRCLTSNIKRISRQLPLQPRSDQNIRRRDSTALYRASSL